MYYKIVHPLYFVIYRNQTEIYIVKNISLCIYLKNICVLSNICRLLKCISMYFSIYYIIFFSIYQHLSAAIRAVCFVFITLLSQGYLFIQWLFLCLHNLQVYLKNLLIKLCISNTKGKTADTLTKWKSWNRTNWIY